MRSRKSPASAPASSSATARSSSPRSPRRRNGRGARREKLTRAASFFFPKLAAPAQRDQQRRGDPERAVERDRRHVAETLDQHAGGEEADRQGIDREHAHA